MGFAVKHPYSIRTDYAKSVAYFCMEYAIHQPLKLYAGGLGFLAGSFLKSAYELQQNVVAIGILWKFGYYDQVRKGDQTMDILFQEKMYGFLTKTDIKFTIQISGKAVWVAAYYLLPEIFRTAPLFLLSTDLPENDYLSQTISHRLYDANPETKIAAAILLGKGGGCLLEHLDWEPEIYHLNESHALPLAFHLLEKYKTKSEVKKRLVFTNHTPEQGGNPETDMYLLQKMGFFGTLPHGVISSATAINGATMNHTLAALRLSGKANGVSALHYKTLCKMWSNYEDICPIDHITNGQHFHYWKNTGMYNILSGDNKDTILHLKKTQKEQLFEIVADQNGELYNSDVLTIVFAKRFADYKRPDLLLRNMDRFDNIVTNKNRPVQIIWAGKPYPMDLTAIGTFDRIVNVCKKYTNCSILVGYELYLSRQLKQAADVWLNNPRLTHEASGTSGMSAAMNGAINISTPDGWFPEFVRDGINGFIIPSTPAMLPDHLIDDQDAVSLYNLLEEVVIPMYYEDPEKWLSIIVNSMNDIVPFFDSNRMAMEYYDKLYN